MFEILTCALTQNEGCVTVYYLDLDFIKDSQQKRQCCVTADTKSIVILIIAVSDLL